MDLLATLTGRSSRRTTPPSFWSLLPRTTPRRCGTRSSFARSPSLLRPISSRPVWLLTTRVRRPSISRPLCTRTLPSALWKTLRSAARSRARSSSTSWPVMVARCRPRTDRPLPLVRSTTAFILASTILCSTIRELERVWPFSTLPDGRTLSYGTHTAMLVWVLTTLSAWKASSSIPLPSPAASPGPETWLSSPRTFSAIS
mmetsp:Transcript_21387/g.61337  ORF Transcript_21387/g.61337 Transcript_21387/m.61337 type:complete len:201 (-) Transcript_21387:140-742(-)